MRTGQALSDSRRVSLRAAAARLRAGAASVPIAGRIELNDEGNTRLSDASGSLVVEPARSDIDLQGRIVGGSLLGARPPHRLEDIVVLTDPSEKRSTEERALTARLPLLARRAEIMQAVRVFFRTRGFLEVETPARVVCPGMEPHLVPFPAGRDRWLATSPELCLKRLLAAGAERVFELARAFRDDERGPLHLSEFALLEWYRAYAGLDELIRDVQALLLETAALTRADDSTPIVQGCDLSKPPSRLTVRDAFMQYAGIDLAQARKRSQLAEALNSRGIAYEANDDWDDLYHRLFIERVEEHLGRSSITILEQYPASQAALARIRPDRDWPVALRFEVYVAGVELANAFDELRDPREQRLRFEADRARRIAAGGPKIDIDEAFMQALASGMPPCVGIALGVDRLIALLLDLPEGPRDALAFPELV